MSRLRRAQESAIENTLRFLQIIKDFNKTGVDYVSSQLQQNCGISKSTYSAAVKLKFIKDKKLTINPERIHALEILEILRQQSSKRVDKPFNDDFIASVERLGIAMNNLSVQQEKALKSPMLSRALNQSEPSQINHLFSQVESNEEKRFELLKAVATGWYADPGIIDFGKTNERIIEATDDLFNKFFKK